MFPHDAGASPSERGGALYVPSSRGSGRIANPELYDEIYLADTPACAIAETFGRFARWTASMLEHRRGRYALATYDFNGPPICALDDARELLQRKLRPSRVVTRDGSVTRMWSERIYRSSNYAGISWWSRYDADWTALALWTTTDLRLTDVSPLATTDAGIIRAATTIVRLIT